MLDLENRTAKTAAIVSGTNNIPTAFSTAAASLALQGISFAENLLVVNGAASALVLNIDAGSPTSAPTTDNLRVPASATVQFNNVKLSSTVYVRSDTGSAISSGTVAFSCW